MKNEKQAKEKEKNKSSVFEKHTLEDYRRYKIVPTRLRYEDYYK